ncbi:scon-2 [Acrasis kona]|uniref:Scon-2 n=1 Tax=Acrasis kona TaxID=1008807 RepID=A0AAW2ZH51_9EUKA
MKLATYVGPKLLNVKNSDEIETVHLDCFDMYATNPCQCMFHETIHRLTYDDEVLIKEKVLTWQKMCTKMRNLEKANKTQISEAQSGEVVGKKRKRPSPKPKKFKARESNEIEEQDDPFLLNLSKDVWTVVFIYLDHTEMYKIMSSCKSFYSLCNMNVVWSEMCNQHVSPHFEQIRNDYFPALNDYYTLYKNTFNKVCTVCRKFCGHDEYKIHRFYYTGTIVCEQCRKLPEYKIISKTDIKSKLKLKDSDIAVARCCKKPNPFRRSTPTYRYLLGQINYIYRVKMVEEAKRYLTQYVPDKNDADAADRYLSAMMKEPDTVLHDALSNTSAVSWPALKDDFVSFCNKK